MSLLTGDDAAYFRALEELLEREPIASTVYIPTLVPTPLYTRESSIWPWKHLYESDVFKRLLQKVGLDDESIARLHVPPLPF